MKPNSFHDFMKQTEEYGKKKVAETEQTIARLEQDPNANPAVLDFLRLCLKNEKAALKAAEMGSK